MMNHPSNPGVLVRLGRPGQLLGRYLLAVGVLPYGVSKLWRLQFQVPAWDYARPLGEASGRILAWSFLGYAPWFQSLLGLLEVVPATLLLFRRTWRLGAILLFPVLLGVSLTNLAMDLWDTTKAIALTLLAMSALLLLSDPTPLRALLGGLLTHPATTASRRWRRVGTTCEIVAAPAIVGAVVMYVLATAAPSMRLGDFTGERQVNRAGTWVVDAFEVPGRRVLEGRGSVMYFDAWNRVYLRAGDRTLMGTFAADRAERTFVLEGLQPEPLQGTYTVDAETLTLIGSHAGAPFRIVLRRLDWGPRGTARSEALIPSAGSRSRSGSARRSSRGSASS